LVNDTLIRSWWAHRQWLDGSLVGATPAVVLEQTGWQRSLGGVGPYLPLFARTGLPRAAVDVAVAAQDVHELPAARGCMYVVPAAHLALALRLGQGRGAEAEIATAKKHFGLTDTEMDRLCAAVLEALDARGEPLPPRALKEAVGGAARDFGPEGVKRGVPSTLPLALGRLEAAGELRRVPQDGRLDQKRYAYVRRKDNPLAHAQLSAEEAQTELARLYFRWAGPARLAHFQWFSALSAKAAKAAVAPLGLVLLAADDDRLLFPDDLEALHAFQASTEPRVALSSNFDNLLHLRRDILALLAAPEHRDYLYGAQGTQQMGGLTDLQSHPILDRGCLIGLWDYDLEAQAIAWATFATPPPALADALAQAVASTETFVRDELGSARGNALDDPKRRLPRIAALRAMAR
jgi:Winged helix DNA-binding domain